MRSMITMYAGSRTSSGITFLRREITRLDTTSARYKRSGPLLENRRLLSVERIVEFADLVCIEDVKETLDRQIQMNLAIAQEGLRGNWGAGIGV